MSDTNIQLLAQLIAEISKFGGADKQKASSLARILLPHIEAYGQEVAREAEIQGVYKLRDAMEADERPNADWHREPFECIHDLMDKVLAELTQKPAEETEGQPETWLYECEVDGEKFEGRPYMVMKICPEHKAEFEKWRKENKRV